MTEHWVQIYSNQKEINYISPSNIRTSVETRSPKLQNLFQFSPPSIPDILWALPTPSFARFCETRISSNSWLLTFIGLRGGCFLGTDRIGVLHLLFLSISVLIANHHQTVKTATSFIFSVEKEATVSSYLPRLKWNCISIWLPLGVRMRAMSQFRGANYQF